MSTVCLDRKDGCLEANWTVSAGGDTRMCQFWIHRISALQFLKNRRWSREAEGGHNSHNHINNCLELQREINGLITPGNKRSNTGSNKPATPHRRGRPRPWKLSPCGSLCAMMLTALPGSPHTWAAWRWCRRDGAPVCNVAQQSLRD